MIKLGKNKTLIKVILVAVIMYVVGAIGLDIPKDKVEQIVDEQLESVTDDESDTVSATEYYEVLSVIDGDTIKVDVAGQVETVRLLGIDAPETEFSSRGEDCFGEESSLYAEELLKGEVVRLVYDESQAERDKFNRILSYVLLSDGRDLGKVMIEGGYAKEYTYKGLAYAKQAAYRQAESVSKAGQVGLWLCE